MLAILTTISEFVLRTFAETWVEPVLKATCSNLNSIMKPMNTLQLCQVRLVVFEGEDGVMGFGKDEYLDELLKQDVLLKVNVGMNATDPVGRVQNLLYGVGSLAQFPAMEGKFNIDEIAKEVFAQLGYKDGTRFLMPTDDVDPQIAELQAQIEQMQMMIETDQVKMQGRMTIEQMKQESSLRAAQLRAQTDLQKQVMGMQGDVGKLDVKRGEAHV